jgi:hypothetical protein
MNDKPQYVQTAFRKAWVLFDLDNGHKWGNGSGKGYMWVFPTRKAATEHKKKYKPAPTNNFVRLSQPIKVEMSTNIKS